MSEPDTTQVEIPLRTEARLPQCRCVLVQNGEPSTAKSDRCAAHVTDPDSPLCAMCEVNHRDLITEGAHFAMVPLRER